MSTLPVRRAPVRRVSYLLALSLVAFGCFRGSPSKRPPIHLNPNMDDQPKYRAQSESAFFADGATMRPEVPGTVARGELHEDGAFWTGREGGELVRGVPLAAIDDAVLARGAQRFGIYCSPCHGERGDGKGMLFQRAQVQSANLTEARVADMPDGQIFETITNGFGLMSSYAYQIPAADRWAIVTHVRVLQGREPVIRTVDVAAPPGMGPGAETEEGP